MSKPLIWMATTGGRGYDNRAHIFRVLDEERPDVIVQGECPVKGINADSLTRMWANIRGVRCIGVHAAWQHFDRAAGPIRNGWMLDLFPIYKLIAFPGDRGTNNAVQQAHAREILVRDERGGE